jgi:hypothetical protein
MNQLALPILLATCLTLGFGTTTLATINNNDNDRVGLGERDLGGPGTITVFGYRVPQIVIPVRILEISDGFNDEIGVDLDVDFSGFDILAPGDNGDTTLYRSRMEPATGLVRFGSFAEDPTAIAEIANRQPVGLAFLNGGQIVIDLRIAPSIVESYVPSDTPATAGDSNSQAFLDAFNAIDESGFGLPQIKMRPIVSQVLVSDGQTILIGFEPGLREYRKDPMIPLLSDVPILGSLFAGKAYRTERNDLVVFITPQIVKSDEDQ